MPALKKVGGGAVESQATLPEPEKEVVVPPPKPILVNRFL
jgi:hypothetical protein